MRRLMWLEQGERRELVGRWVGEAGGFGPHWV